jgi:hypothetical protein
MSPSLSVVANNESVPSRPETVAERVRSLQGKPDNWPVIIFTPSRRP